MIVEQVRRGIKIAVIRQETSLRAACAKTEMPESTIYRFMGSKSDISIVKLHNFCVAGFGMSLMEILELGKK